LMGLDGAAISSRQPARQPRNEETVPYSASPWWHPHNHADRRPFLMTRNRIVAAIRRHFEAQGFVEVECAALQDSPGNEAHVHAMPVGIVGMDGMRDSRWLHTSPEFACKKLLAAGETRIFDLARVFRNRERSPLHAPEFTMLEWYRARESYDTVMADTASIVRLAAETAGSRSLSWRGRRADPLAEPERLTVAEAFARYAGIDLLKTLTCHAPDRDGFAAQAKAQAIDVAPDDSWSDIFSRVLSEAVEPRLGVARPTLLYEYPTIEAALARPCAHDPRVAERFELYVCGVELANGFGELTDAAEQRRRFEAEMDIKQRVYGERHPIDEDFLDALAHMPPASGVALGVDRLVMLAAGAERIDQVMWTPFNT
jgi:elongation factor P--(R)-beta-lysine ligase